jgi:hypothetical protein
MNPKSIKRIGLISAVVASATGLAQGIVDVGGVRNPFFSNAGSTLGLEGFSAKFDTSAQSIEGLYLTQRPFNRTILPGNWIYGADLKFTPVNGITHINGWPQTDLSLLANYTHELKDSQIFFSDTIRLVGSFGQDIVYDNKGDLSQQPHNRDEFMGSIFNTVGIAPILRIDNSMYLISIAISTGYSATNNYPQLPKATVGSISVTNGSQSVVNGTKVVRYGQLDHYNAFPLSLLLPVQIDWALPSWTARIFDAIGGDNKGATYIPILSPYATLTPAEEGKPRNAIGLNLVIRGLGPVPKDPKDDTPHPEQRKLTFPINVFVQRDNAFTGKPSTSVGAGLIFKFP